MAVLDRYLAAIPNAAEVEAENDTGDHHQSERHLFAGHAARELHLCGGINEPRPPPMLNKQLIRAKHT